METIEFHKTILSQYANSGKLLWLLERFNEAVDPKVDIKKFYDEVFNLDTCGTYGLDVWGVIVAAPRCVQILELDYFGFDGSQLQPFNQAPFWSGAPATTFYRMGNDAYRQMIYFKALVNIMNTTLPSISSILYEFFRRMRREQTIDVYTQRTGVMQMRVVFRFALTQTERAILRTYGTLIRPGGVGMEFYEIPLDSFGFQGSKLRPFNQGAFFNGKTILLDDDY